MSNKYFKKILATLTIIAFLGGFRFIDFSESDNELEAATGTFDEVVAYGMKFGDSKDTANNIYIYLNAGETLDLTFTMNYVYPGANFIGEYKLFDSAGNEVGQSPIPDSSVEGSVETMTYTASTTGVYVLYGKSASAILSDISNDIKIEISDTNGDTYTGRSWAHSLINYTYQGDNGTPSRMNDVEYYAVVENGYMYKIDLLYNGVSSNFSINSVGAVESGTCTPIYRDLYVNGTPGVEYAINSTECIDKGLSTASLFFSQPSEDIPESVTVPSIEATFSPTLVDIATTGEFITVHAYPRIENHIPEFMPIVYTKDALDTHAGTFEYGVNNFSGIAELGIEIDYDRDGVVDDVVTYYEYAGDGEVLSYAWDGKDSIGNDVPLSAKVEFYSTIDKFGELHVNMYDVEYLESFTVERLNSIKPYLTNEEGTALYPGYDINTDAARFDISYDATEQVELVSTNPNTTSLCNDIVSPVEGTYNSFDDPDRRDVYAKDVDNGYTQKPSGTCTFIAADGVEYPREVYSDQVDTDNWVYDNVDYRNLVLDAPGSLTGNKMVEDTTGGRDVDGNSIPNGIVEPGETVTYTIAYFNQGSIPLTEVIVSDPFDDPKFDGAVINNVDVEKFATVDYNSLDGNLSLESYSTSSDPDSKITVEYDSNSSPSVSVDVGVLEVADYVVLKVNMTLSKDMPVGPPLENQGVASSAELEDVYTDGVIGGLERETPGGGSITVIPTAGPMMVIEKYILDDDNKLTEDENSLTYKIMAGNVGTSEALGVVVSDDLSDPNLSFENITDISAKVVVYDESTGEYIDTTRMVTDIVITADANGIAVETEYLLPGEYLQIDFIIQVAPEANVVEITNTASVTGDNFVGVESTVSIPVIKEVLSNSGFVSYFLLGIVSLLTVFLKKRTGKF